jgi:UDP-N-acetylglucosamine 2-epimerase (non-hydrolysing)
MIKSRRIKILIVFGTRPEAIKIIPVINELRRYRQQIAVKICITAQHREMLDQVMTIFKITPDYDLNLMELDQTLTGLTARVLEGMELVLKKEKPDWVMVQGDTTTVMAVSIASFYQGIKVAHIEAGLRTYNKRAPFPEEINRRLTSVLADLHFAPTETAKRALLHEGISVEQIMVTGNTVIDALDLVKKMNEDNRPFLQEQMSKIISNKILLVVTGHRRENFGEGLKQICLALKDIVKSNPKIFIVYPVHLNPNVKKQVKSMLNDNKNILLTDPLPYTSFIWLMSQAYLVLTDSGGIQEEAPSLGKPLLVMRGITERPEGVKTGNALIVGTNRIEIVKHVADLINNREKYNNMAKTTNLYGDGKAAKYIVSAILNYGRR